jgi:Xaa-Pro aminopeptidase
LVDQMTGNWEPVAFNDGVGEMAPHCGPRRDAVGAAFSGLTLVIPSGGLKSRTHDTEYNFRPGTEFFYLTGCSEPDAVLVITGASSTLFIPERRDSSTHEFFTNGTHGEVWVGPRRGTVEAAAYYDIATAPLDALDAHLATQGDVALVRGYDAHLDALVAPHERDGELHTFLAEQRLIKSEYEVAQLQLAIDSTVRGFEDVVRALPTAIGRNERVIEGIFNLRARVEGNDVGYNTIAASGSHATVLHWTRNNGDIRDGEMLLLDAGVEWHTLYTADVTRTLPINGRFSDTQRRVYELVLEAQEAGIAAAVVGASFGEPHRAAMLVLARGLRELGIIDEEPDVAIRPDRQLHRRYTLHGTSHMLGIDVHDCAQSRNEMYMGELKAGYVLTVEPGLYFQINDLTVPAELRGIGVRIEDDILVTENGPVNLSAGLPRTVADIEAWMARLTAQATRGLLSN